MKNLNLGNWDSALFKSLFTSSLLIPIVYLTESFQLNSFELSELFGLFVSFLLYIGVFLLFSLVGWLLIGFPIHLLVCKFNSTNYFYYALVPALFLCVSYFTNGPLLLGLVALTQALLFRYFVFKIKT